MGLHYYGLRATNAGYSVDFLNLVPVVTFITAVILRYVTSYIILHCRTLLKNWNWNCLHRSDSMKTQT